MLREKLVLITGGTGSFRQVPNNFEYTSEDNNQWVIKDEVDRIGRGTPCVMPCDGVDK